MWEPNFATDLHEHCADQNERKKPVYKDTIRSDLI